MIGLHLTFDDRPDEWVDPAIEEWEEDGDLVVDNGHYEYRFPLAHITDRIEYEMIDQEDV